MYRKLLLILLAVILPFTLPAEELIGKKASDKIAGTKLLVTNSISNVPSFIVFEDHISISEEKAFSVLKHGLEMRDEDSWRLYREQKDDLGFTHKRYHQYYGNIKVETGEYILHIRNGAVRHMNGVFYDRLNLSTSPALSEQQALQSALEYTGASVYKWQLAIEEQHCKDLHHDLDATFFPKGELVIMAKDANFFPETRDFRLCYKFDIYAHEPMSREYVYVDAQSGEIIFAESRICHLPATGTANTRYAGTQTITTDSIGPANFRLRDYTLGSGVFTWDLNTGTSYGAAVDFTDADNNWTSTANMDDAAYDAHWGAEQTYLYFLNVHSRNSFDDLGSAINSYVHYGINYVNAFWNGSVMTYGDGNGTQSDPLTPLDVVGHEITHGVTNYSSNLIYSYESGALNESFSDIFGAAIEFYASPSQADWLIGEDCWTPLIAGDALRYMDNPNTANDPDTYLGTHWHTSSTDNGGVHTNSGVQNFWFYLLSDGGSGTNDIGNAYNVTALGITKAEQIAYRNNNFYLTPSSQYADARTYSIQSAVDLYGACTQEVESTTNAWYAVGVGPIYSSTVEAAYSSPDSSCSAPFTVNFTNQSTNAGQFIWDFGDGTTSNAASPTHVYNNYGTYTVKLFADGGACGVDSVEVVDQIVIDSSFTCIAFAGDAIQTACNGILYDSGGPNNNYPDNTDLVTTIAPVNAANVTLTFTLFDVEPATNCIYDYIEIFDGPNTSAPSLGRFCNTTGSPGTITSSGPSITVLQHSDGFVTGEGFVAEWSCFKLNQAPLVDFTSDVTATCTGEVQFSDLTIGNPISWNWDFGDGNSSNLKDPLHIYTQAGIYNVTLVALNSFGADSVVKSAYVEVTRPSAPAVSGDESCGPESLTLLATASVPSNSINWYQQASGGPVINTGTSYVTPLLNNSTTYYVEEAAVSPVQKVGPGNNTIGGGGYFTGFQYLIFDALEPFNLVSVYVYANGAGNRTIELRNNSGSVLQDTTVNLVNGGQRVTLNFEVGLGTDLQLGTISGVSANLYRNTSGASYPYTLGSMVSIKNSSFSSDYYYFFYDWEVKGEDCISSRVAVNADIYPEPSASAITTTESCAGMNDGAVDLSVSGGTSPYVYLWSNGVTNQDLNNLKVGTYTVLVSDVNDCNATLSVQVGQQPGMSITTGKSNVTCNDADNGSARAVVSGGSPGYTYHWDTSPAKTTDEITGLPGGSYTVTTTDSRGCTKSSVITIFNPAAIGAFSIPNNPSPGDINLLVTGGIAPYTFNWSNGSTSEDLTGAVPGQFYFCQIADRNSCARIHALVMPSPQSRPGNTNAAAGYRAGMNDRIDVFPNPAQENVALVFNAEEGSEYRITLRDARGKAVLSENGRSEGSDVRVWLNLSTVSDGIYFIEIQRSSGIRTEKLLVQQ